MLLYFSCLVYTKLIGSPLQGAQMAGKDDTQGSLYNRLTVTKTTTPGEVVLHTCVSECCTDQQNLASLPIHFNKIGPSEL